MRISSSRHVVGVDTVWANAGMGVPSANFPRVVLAVGISASSACPTGLMGTAAMLVTGFGPVFGQSAGFSVQTVLKLPALSAAEGTLISAMVAGFFSRRHSWEKKKNVFCFSEL